MLFLMCFENVQKVFSKLEMVSVQNKIEQCEAHAVEVTEIGKG